jgi:hypothetical protein
MSSERPDIVSPAQPGPLHHGMGWLSGRLADVGAIKIVAISSSTTAGEGDIVPYPSGSNALRAGCVGRNIDVLNRGGVRQAKQTEEGKPTFPGHIQIRGWAVILGGRRTTSRGIPRESQS